MFTVEERDRLRDYVLEMARNDPRVVAGAIVGSLVSGEGDQWSDVDLTFAVSTDYSIADVLAEWTSDLAGNFQAVTLFDLPLGAVIYRVFLLPKGLQLDISFAPANEFRATSSRFDLVFGDVAVKTDHVARPSPSDVLGWAVLYAKDARIAIERGRWWQAEHIIANLRHRVLDLACLRLGLPARYGKGSDRLPPEVLDGFEDTLVRGLGREQLLSALRTGVKLLLQECARQEDPAPEIQEKLLEVLF
jgi:hypothetical protein